MWSFIGYKSKTLRQKQGRGMFVWFLNATKGWFARPFCLVWNRVWVLLQRLEGLVFEAEPGLGANAWEAQGSVLFKTPLKGDPQKPRGTEAIYRNTYCLNALWKEAENSHICILDIFLQMKLLTIFEGKMKEKAQFCGLWWINQVSQGTQ